MGIRLKSLDVAKGIAIILVALFHTGTGFLDYGHVAGSSSYIFLSTLAYGFHVQIFFLISGYLSFEKASHAAFQLCRQVNLYYTYLLWSLLSLILVLHGGGLTNHHFGLKNLYLLPVCPILHFWFLLVLMVATALLYVLRSPAVLIVTALALSVASQLHWDYLEEIGYFTFFMVLGALLRYWETLPRVSLLWGSVSTALACVGALVAIHYNSSMCYPAYYLFSVAACYALYCVSTYLARCRVGPCLAFVGQKSLSIYVAHVIFATAVRYVAFRVHPAFLYSLGVVVATAIAVCGPILLCAVTDRLGVSRWIGLGQLMTVKDRVPNLPQREGQTGYVVNS